MPLRDESAEPTPARCTTCSRLHPTVMKPKAKMQDGGGPLGYGTRTLPREFWTPKAAQ